MKKKDFLNIISQPVQLKNEHIFELEEIIERFPYFQTARVLHLKALKIQKSSRYNQNLRTTAAYTSDRSVLFHYITSEDFSDIDLNNQESKIITEIEEIDERVTKNLEEDAFTDKVLIKEKNSKTLEEESLDEESENQEFENSLTTENLGISPLDIELENLNILGAVEEEEEEEEEGLYLEKEMTDSVDNNKESDLSKNTDSIEKENDAPDETSLLPEIKTSFELDSEQTIEPEIHEDDIEIYIESYSGQLDKEEIRALLDAYKAKSDAESLESDSSFDETVLNFELSKDNFGIQTEDSDFDSASKIAESNIIDEGGITVHPETLESKTETSNNLFDSLFEIDSQETIETLVDIDNLENASESTNTIFDLSFEPIIESNNSENLQKENTKEELVVEEELRAEEKMEAEPVNFDKDDTHSFNEWLQLSSFKPIDRSESIPKEVKKEKNKELIDIFIDKNPKITPIKSSTSSTSIQLNEEETNERQTVMTETLAQIYTDQKKYKSAIKAYEVLSLKFPEKSGFFADQIKMLKKLKQE